MSNIVDAIRDLFNSFTKDQKDLSNDIFTEFNEIINSVDQSQPLDNPATDFVSYRMGVNLNRDLTNATITFAGITFTMPTTAAELADMIADGLQGVMNWKNYTHSGIEVIADLDEVSGTAMNFNTFAIIYEPRTQDGNFVLDALFPEPSLLISNGWQKKILGSDDDGDLYFFSTANQDNFDAIKTMVQNVIEVQGFSLRNADTVTRLTTSQVTEILDLMLDKPAGRYMDLRLTNLPTSPDYPQLFTDKGWQIVRS